MKLRSVLLLSILPLCAGPAAGGGRRYQAPSGTADTGSVSASPTPPAHHEPQITKVEQRLMNIGEMVEYFSDLKMGTALRLTYSNGAEYAGNFDGREPGRALIYCTNGLAGRRQVPLRKVMDAYIIMSSTWTLRIHHKNFPWKN